MRINPLLLKGYINRITLISLILLKIKRKVWPKEFN
jgi:hypothetical protein